MSVEAGVSGCHDPGLDDWHLVEGCWYIEPLSDVYIAKGGDAIVTAQHPAVGLYISMHVEADGSHSGVFEVSTWPVRRVTAADLDSIKVRLLEHMRIRGQAAQTKRAARKALA